MFSDVFWYWQGCSEVRRVMSDNVNHPPHYTQGDAKCPACSHPIECIDVTRHMMFNAGNAVKYVWRYEMKGGIEDLKKAVWYLQDLIKKLETK